MRRRSAFFVCSALAVSLVAGGALAASGAEPAVAASGPDAFEITFKPEWVNTGWTVPETVDGVEVTIAGAPGRGPDGGAGAAFTFHTDTLVPGTTLDVQFGPRSDGRFSALAAAAGGTGGNARESGLPGGDGTMLIQRSSGDLCAEAPSTVIAVAGGGGGASGTYETSRFWWEESATVLEDAVPGENSTFWNSGGPTAVRDACGTGAGAKGGQAAKTGWFSHLTAGGGGGGGLSSGVGGTAQFLSGWQQLERNGFGFVSREEIPVYTPATGGEAGTSYVSWRACGASCPQPEITPNTGSPFVTLRWTETRATSVTLNGVVDGAVDLGTALIGTVTQLRANSGYRPYQDELSEGSVVAWIGDERVAETRPSPRGRFELDLAAAIPIGSRSEVLVEFVPDDPTLHRPAAATAMVTTVLSTPSFSFMNYRDAEGSTWLIADMRSYAPASIALTPTTFQISTRGTDQSEAVVRGDVATTTLVHMACALVKLGDEPLEVTASYAGDARHTATTSRPYLYKANADPRRYTYYDQCERTDLTAAAPAARTSVVDDTAESAATMAAADSTDSHPVTVAWVAPSDTIAAGAPVSLAVDVAHEGSALDEGVVDFIVDGELVGSAAPVDGRFALELAPLTSGPHVIDAVYSDPADETDEASHPGAAAEQRTVTVSPEPVELALEVDGLEQAVPGGPVTVRASASATATDEDVEGQVVFFDDDLFLGVAPLTDGIAALEGTTLNEESNTVRAWLQTDPQRWAEPGEVSVPAAYPMVATSLSLSVDDVSIADSEGDVLVELVGGSEAHPATGSVALYDGDSELLALSSADEVPARDGVTTAWSVPVSSLAIGTLDLSAVFTGGPGVASAQSATTVVELGARPTAVSARVDGTTLSVTATADSTSLTDEARGAKPWGVIAVHRGSDVLGYATVVDGTATVDLPDSVSASSLRIEFLPVSADLSSSETTVRVGALARTGTSAPDALLAVALLTLAGVALLAFGRRRATS